MYGPLHVRDGDVLRLGTPQVGVRTYLAVRGGIAVQPVLGSRSTDTLSGLGPAPMRRGQVLPIGPPARRWPTVDHAPSRNVHTDPTLRFVPGPRANWFTDEALNLLASETYTVSADSDRIAVRLQGPPLPRSDDRELPPEGTVTGAIQVPPDGQPIVFGVDHPVTGGYPVIAVVVRVDLGLVAQLRPGQRLRLALHGPG
jgi:biotin-dependent carboxylase-like uncharacterized protein